VVELFEEPAGGMELLVDAGAELVEDLVGD
jgi:hypothetical protein